MTVCDPTLRFGAFIRDDIVAAMRRISPDAASRTHSGPETCDTPTILSIATGLCLDRAGSGGPDSHQHRWGRLVGPIVGRDRGRRKRHCSGKRSTGRAEGPGADIPIRRCGRNTVKQASREDQPVPRAARQPGR